jgi:polyphosphate kinase
LPPRCPGLNISDSLQISLGALLVGTVVIASCRAHVHEHERSESMSTPTTPTPAGAATTGPSLFLNRELSWLEFNRRVLHEALDERTPLLERVRFLAIFNSNLDEFFQKRVGGLKRQLNARLQPRSPDGLTPQEQLDAIRKRVMELLTIQADCYRNTLRPALAANGVHLLNWDQLTEPERAAAKRYFDSTLFPVLTPLAVDPGHPFPFISNLSTSLGVVLRHPPMDAQAHPRGDGPIGELHFARLKVPSMLSPWINLASLTGTVEQPSQGAAGATEMNFRFVALDQIIRNNLKSLFEGMIIEAIEPFRISRNADVERDEEDAEDLLELIEQEVRERRFAEVIRLEIDGTPHESMTRFLMQEMELEASDVYQMPAELDYTEMNVIADLNLPALKNEPFAPIVPSRLADDGDIFSVIRAGDVLVHHPYESFRHSVEKFITAAASDPRVIAIKQTLYRTSADSPFIPALIRAADGGKQVVCLVELKARFDEEQNIQVAQALEKAGVHVVYGIVGLKTHTKTSLVVRQEADGVRSYAHIGTGNYNSKTAQLYTDLGLFTAKPEIVGDVVELFHYLTGHSLKKDFRRLLVAPINMRRRFVEMIDREIAHAKTWHERGADPSDPHRPMIVAKMNSLEDQKIAMKLYEASKAGVRVKLVVRGFCCLKPGVAGLSENISVISVIGRFLEHSRIYYFHNNAASEGGGEYYIGSADWMYRNLNNRVECITPVLDPTLSARLWTILNICLSDQRQAWDMQPDGGYTQRSPKSDDATGALGTHRTLMDLTRRESQITSGK